MSEGPGSRHEGEQQLEEPYASTHPVPRKKMSATSSAPQLQRVSEVGPLPSTPPSMQGSERGGERRSTDKVEPPEQPAAHAHTLAHTLTLGLTRSLSLSLRPSLILSRTLARAPTPSISPAQVVSLYGEVSSGGAQPTRSRVSLQPLGKEHKKKRRQVDKMLQESPFAQTAGFPALPGVTPTKNGGRGDKPEVPNLFANPAQVRRSHSKCSQARARQSYRQYSQAQAVQRPGPDEVTYDCSRGRV